MALALPDGWLLWWRVDESPFETWLARRGGSPGWFDATVLRRDDPWLEMSWHEHVNPIAALCERLDHRSLPRVMARLESDEAFALVRERSPGACLDALLAGARRGGVAPHHADAARVIADVAEGLEALRGVSGFAHGALDGACVRVSPRGDGMLWSPWTTAPASQAHVTGRSQLAPSIRYAAPERVRGLAIDARADVYALGVMLHEALTLRRPFDAPTDFERLMRVVQGPPLEPVRALNPRVPASLEAVVARAASRDASSRFGTPGELAEALAPWRAEAAREPSGYRDAPTMGWFARDARPAARHLEALHDPRTARAPAPTWAALREECCGRLAAGRCDADDVITLTTLRDAALPDLRRLRDDPSTAGASRPLLARLLGGVVDEAARAPRRVSLGLVEVDTCPRGWSELAPTPHDAVRHCDVCDERVTLARGDLLTLAAGRRCVRTAL